jgi:uncharacterized protein (DUF1015 family)
LPEFLPFRGLRYRHDDLAAVTAPPYDVIDADDRAVLAARSPHNAVHLLLPEGDYAGAARELARWQADGVLARDDTDAFYGYRMSFTDDHGRDRTTNGVIGALELPAAAGEGDVLPHERTLPKAKSDRLALLEATRANLDPIWGLTTASALPVATGGPDQATTDDDGVRHALTRIDDPGQVDAIRRAVASAPLVLADGHHRFETAIAYRNGLGDAAAAADGRVMCLVVELAEEQLWVQPIHRVYDGVDGRRLRDALGTAFTLEDVGPNEPDALDALQRRLPDGGMGLVDATGLTLLVPRDAASATADLPPELREVPSARFEAIAEPALDAAGLTEVAVEYRADAAIVAALVAKGAADAAILLPPVTVEQIRAAAHARLRMPQKTTYFAPKPRSGLVYRLLDG